MEKTAFTLLLLSALCQEAVGLFGQHVYVPVRKTWLEAQEHCRENYTDLSSVRSQEDADILKGFVDEDIMPGRTWIGLYRDPDDVTGWKWSDGGITSSLSWANQHPKNGDGELCAAHGRHRLHSENCGHKKFFSCFKRSIVVTENRTWEEALEYCREHHRDLPSLVSEAELVQALQESRREAQTRGVWTGLRYLAGQWLWVNGDPLEYEAWGTHQGERPRCPAWHLHCGALPLEGQHWVNWHCQDRLNFICLM